MIPITQIGSVKEYDAFINNFVQEITEIINRGYIGQRKPVKVSEVITVYDSLSGAIKVKYLKAIKKDEAKLRKLDPKRKIYAPLSMLGDSETALLQKLINDLPVFARMSPDMLKGIIAKNQKEFPVNSKGKIDTKHSIYEIVYYVFVKLGYNKKGFKDMVWKVTNLRVCPYCNRIYIPFIPRKSKLNLIKGQLDHFYPKETYPYLAISLYNLVPSCTYCNGASCKGTKDPYVEKIVSPFNLKDHKGLRFRIKSFDEKYIDLDQCAKSIVLDIDTSLNSDMENNVETFHLIEIYSFHRDIAADIVHKHTSIKSRHYIDHINRILQLYDDPNEVKVAMKDFLRLYWGMSLDEDKLGDRPMSKFTLDLINDLNENHTSS